MTAWYELGYRPNLRRPQSFNEKILWLKLNRRDLRLVRIADKIAVRDHVRERLGTQIANELILPILWSGADPRLIPFDALPASFVVKANHGTQCNIFVRDREQAVEENIIERCSTWLSTTYGAIPFEWHYAHIEPRILIEPLMQDGNGVIPVDYKLFCFHGRVELVQVDFDRQIRHSRSLFDRDFNILPVTLKYRQGKEIEKPPRFHQMLEIAEALAGDFEFIRIDLYNLAGRIVFGEMTAFPEGGMGRFDPRQFDFDLGHRLRLKGLEN